MLFTDNFKKVVYDSDCEAIYGAPMSEYTSFQVGGMADLLVIPKTEEALLEILQAAKTVGVPITIIGNGSNLLVSDNGIRGLVIRTVGGLTNLSCNNGIIECGAGVSLKKLCMAALECSLSGLEFAFGIPGSLGGALFMNAGAYCGEMKDVIVSSRHITDDLLIKEFSSNELCLSYRSSVYSKNDYIITGATLSLSMGDKAEIRAKMDDYMGRRRDKQPLTFPSAGSAFKRPEGHYAGALIEQCGLKGYSIGGAAVSEKHAGFIINKGGATAEDILRLIEHVKAMVYREKGVLLEPEVRMLGF